MIAPEPFGPREEVWREALRSETGNDRAEAAFRLGRMLGGVGEVGVAEELLYEAAASADPRIAPRASWALADALLAEGRSEEAAHHLSRVAAAAAADPHLSPDVTLALASRCEVVGQVEAAVSLYRDLLCDAVSEEREHAALAAYRLAEILRDRERPGEVADLLARAFSKGSQSLKPYAAIELSELAVVRKHPTLLEYLLNFVVCSEHPDLAPRAGYELALLRRAAGDQVETLKLLRAVALSAHPYYGPMAEDELLELIGELDVSEAVDDLVADVLGDGQMDFAADAIHRGKWGTSIHGLRAEPRKVVAVPRGAWLVVLHVRPRPASGANPSDSPLLLEAGEKD